MYVYECGNCGEVWSSCDDDYEHCPKCGSSAIAVIDKE